MSESICSAFAEHGQNAQATLTAVIAARLAERQMLVTTDTVYAQ